MLHDVLDIRSMAGRTKAKRTTGGRPATGRVKVLVSIEPAQLAALRGEAFRRAAAQPRARPDVGEVVRELVSEWMAKRPRTSDAGPRNPAGR